MKKPDLHTCVQMCQRTARHLIYAQAASALFMFLLVAILVFGTAFQASYYVFAAAIAVLFLMTFGLLRVFIGARKRLQTEAGFLQFLKGTDVVAAFFSEPHHVWHNSVIFRCLSGSSDVPAQAENQELVLWPRSATREHRRTLVAGGVILIVVSLLLTFFSAELLRFDFGVQPFLHWSCVLLAGMVAGLELLSASLLARVERISAQVEMDLEGLKQVTDPLQVLADSLASQTYFHLPLYRTRETNLDITPEN